MRPRSPSAYRVTQSSLSGAAVFHIQGELDAATAAGLRRELGEAVGLPAVLVELTGVGLIDSIGLGVLVGIIRRVHEHGGAVAIAGASARRGIAAALLAAGIDRLVFVADAPAGALEWLLKTQDSAPTVSPAGPVGI